MWRIDSTQLHMVRLAKRRGWAFITVTKADRDWLSRHDLRQAVFRTRRDAVQTVAAYLHTDSPPPTEPVKLIALRRDSDGVYRSAASGRTVTRHREGGWEVQILPSNAAVSARVRELSRIRCTTLLQARIKLTQLERSPQASSERTDD